jgi:hypothetical protein
MPDDPRPTSSPPASGEFNFDGSPSVEKPRIKRRSLKPRPVPTPSPAAAEAAPAAHEPEPDRFESTAAATPPPEETPAPARTTPNGSSRPAQAAVPGRVISPTGYVSSRPAAASTPPSSTTPNPGLYYSSGARPEPERLSATPHPPMKPSTPTPAAATPSSTVSTYRATPGTTPRASTASDFRANIDRQSREQKSVGNVLSYVVYAIGALLILGAGLAIYGGYVLSQQIHQQSVTMSDLDARYAAENKSLTDTLGVTNDSLSQAQAQIHRQEEMIARQQDTINKLVTTNDEIVAALKQERLTRASETSNLRARVRSLEDETTPAR